MRDPDVGASERGALRAAVIERYLPFARRLSRRYRGRGVDDADLEQVAALALVRAVDGFEPDRGTPFFGYLVPTVLGAVKRHFRDNGWAVRVGRRLQERKIELEAVRAALTQRLSRAPTAGELAAALDVSEHEMADVLAVGNAYGPESLDAPVGADDDSGDRLALLGADDPALETLCDRLAVRQLLAGLPDRERIVLTRYFFGGERQADIADDLGVSQVWVSRLITSTAATLRQRLDDLDAAAQPAEGAGLSAYPAGRHGCVVRVRGCLTDDGLTTRLRNLLVDTVVRRKPARLVIDLRGVADLPPAQPAGLAVVRALVDGYRAGATAVQVIGVPAGLFELLRRLQVTRLFLCRPRAEAGAETTFTARLAGGVPVGASGLPRGVNHGAGWGLRSRTAPRVRPNRAPSNSFRTGRRARLSSATTPVTGCRAAAHPGRPRVTAGGDRPASGFRDRQPE